MLLGCPKDEHFSYFHSSCQLGLSDLHQDRKAQFTTKIYALFSILNISGNMTANTHLQLCGKLQWDEIFCEGAFSTSTDSNMVNSFQAWIVHVNFRLSILYRSEDSIGDKTFIEWLKTFAEN